MPIPAMGVGALFGMALASFLNVVLTRVPRGESVVAPRSRCRTCRRALAWWENIPVASWLALGGRCRTCRAPIGLRLLLVELAGGAAGAAAAWWSCGPALAGAAGGPAHG